MSDTLRRLRELERAATPPGIATNDAYREMYDVPFLAAARRAFPALLDVAEAALAVFEDLYGYDDDPELGVRLGAALTRLEVEL